MPSFQPMFTASQGRPIEYMGQTLVMVDHFPLDGCRRVRFTFEACNAECRQGAYLRVSGGEFVANGQRVANAVCFWQDTALATFEFVVDSQADVLEVRNVWDWRGGVMESWHHGAAMIVDELPGGRRYRCNDGDPDDDFDDIVFRLERVA